MWSQHLKSSEFDEVMQVSGSVFINRGGSANPCFGRTMGKQKHKIARLKMRLHQAAYTESLRGKSDNEVAAEVKLAAPDFLSTRAWKELRAKVLEKYGAKCMCCGYTSDDKRRIHVDHIKPRRYFPELSLVFENLQVLCRFCNKAKGNNHATDYRRIAKGKA